MKQILFENATLVLTDRLIPDGALLVRDGRIHKLGPGHELKGVSADQTVDVGGGYLAPGYIDLHIHGLKRFLIDSGPQDLEGICRELPAFGVTGFLPTVCPRPVGKDALFLKDLAKVVSKHTRILGFHLEGPFLTKTGALPPEALGQADTARVKNLQAAARPFPAVFSISPDFKGILPLIDMMRGNGTAVFMTHTAADVKQTQAAIEHGARHATHFYDVFPVPAETDPGVRPCGAVEAILADSRASVDFILDGEHVNPVAVQMALACKGPDRVCLITDANIGAALAPGRYQFPGSEITFAFEGAPARMTENSHMPGALAGSGLTLDKAVRNAISMVGVDIPQAVRMASANPAQVLGLKDVTGSLHEGLDADLIVLDSRMGVAQTWVRGSCCYTR